MTEAEWLDCIDPEAMLNFLRSTGVFSDRKARLFAVALCYRLWPLLPDPRSHRAVVVGERFADGHASADELDAAMAAAFDVGDELVKRDDPRLRPFVIAAWCAYDAAHEAECAEGTASQAAEALGNEHEPDAQAHLIRCLFHPFTVLSRHPSWRSPVVGALAQTIYDERQFVDLPILADALEDVGCTDNTILSHLRGPGPHVRGCWAVDLILGKE